MGTARIDHVDRETAVLSAAAENSDCRTFGSSIDPFSPILRHRASAIDIPRACRHLEDSQII
jgi:hypothetical protein